MDAQELRNLQEAYMEVYSIDEATRMRRELGKEGEIAIRQKLARDSNAYQRSGSVDNTIAAAEREADRTTARNRDETSDDYKGRMQKRSQTLTKLAANRRGSVRSGEGLRGYAANVSGGDRVLQSARGSARSAGTLTPKEKKQLGEEYDLYNIILSHLLDEGYASTEESADKIILNMSESWFEQIVEDYVVVNKDGSREIVKGDPPKPEVKSGYDYTHTEKQKEKMKKTPKTKIGSRFD